MRACDKHLRGTENILNHNMTTILITGSEGVIGQSLVNYFHTHHPDVRLIRISLSNSNNPEIITGDLNDRSVVKKIFNEQPIDYVIHTAAFPYGKAGFDQPYTVFENDTGILMNILHEAQTIKKFIYLSSVLVYESSTTVPFTEDQTEHIPPPQSPYGLAKFFGEKAIQLFSKQTNIPYTIWRAYNVVSPRERLQSGGGHVFMDFYHKLFVEQAPSITIHGSGQQVRCFTWVEDLVQGIVDHLTHEKTNNQIINIGNNEPITLLELMEMLLMIGKEKKLLPADYQPEIVTGSAFHGIDSAVRLPSNKKIIDLLNWKASTNVPSCFENFISQKATYDHE